MFYDEPSDTPYEAYDPSQGGGGGGKEIMVKVPGGLTEFATISPLVQALNKEMAFRRLHFAGQWRELVYRVVAGAGRGG
jgi:hypothetical protein